ncbi:MAG: precorrin-6y C5,15-methyltransferase (decarboxylating) subunit CbiE [Treponema sp.]|jgi:precorrin-6Y C5,15-methyltransferase (decarboxylating)|nr:precorrin-6y C5,15-methyltransferase (decarboxylating) subunit CbiE [Treponema sp.]
MKEIVIIGAGLGVDTLTAEGLSALTKAEVCFGAPRLLALFEGLFSPEQETYPFYKAEDIKKAMAHQENRHCAILVSGDTGFYSAAAGLCEALHAFKPRLIPGVSSLNAFFARLHLPWQDAVLFSAHGRQMEDAAAGITGLVRRNRLVFCLTGGNAAALGAALSLVGFENLPVFTGENLGTPEEKISSLKVAELSRSTLAPLTVLLTVNDHASDALPSGIPEGDFLRAEHIPMTKSEIRAVALSKLGIKPDYVCYDIGAGTGSVSVEMALQSWRGRVYAIERRGEARSLIGENCRGFHIGNVSIVEGEAPEVLEALPPPDAVFIGGSGGKVLKIIEALQRKNRNVRIVVSAVTLETSSVVLAAFPDAEASWISVSRGKKVGECHLLSPQNPVMIITLGGTP